MSRREDRDGRRPPRSRLRVLALLSAAMVLAAGCGARWDDDQRAAVAARYAEGSGSGESASGVSGDAASEAAGDAATGDAATGSGAPTGSSGSGGQSGTGSGGAAGSSSKPCAAKSSAPGVSDDQITVGSISSLSGPVPGIGASAAAGARAYVAYLNANNGVCGRKIVLKEADDGTDNGRHRAVVTELGPRVLGLTGGFGAGDVGAVDVLRQQKIPVAGLPSGQAVADLPNVFDLNPKFKNENAVIGKYRYIKQQGGTSVALVYLAIDQSRAEARTQRNLMEAAGIKVVLQQELPIQTLSYDSTARKVANSGANYLFFIGDTNSNASMARAMYDTGHKLKFSEMFTLVYGTSFIQRGGQRRRRNGHVAALVAERGVRQPVRGPVQRVDGEGRARAPLVTRSPSTRGPPPRPSSTRSSPCPGRSPAKPSSVSSARSAPTTPAACTARSSSVPR